MPTVLTNPTAALARRAAGLAGIDAALVFSGCRESRVSQIRFAAWYLARKQGWTLAKLADALHRDHAAVIHGLRRADHLLKTDPWFRDLVNALSA